ncbi:ATP-binding protein [Prosthecomicrobium sp. N25]|uniref:ATP-binding protein n=1 Tax=Prosthecomicrobium sp. N25 TaxID=3129254 RepID=UPI0030778EAF
MTTGTPEPDLAACAAEPIHIPGAIQPHGALVILDPATLHVRHASRNLAEVTGLALPPGSCLAETPEAAALVALVRGWDPAVETRLLRVVPVADRSLQLVGHATDQGLILEFEALEPDTATLEAFYPRLGRFLDEIAGAADVGAIAEIAVREIRSFTGFDRVLLYTFDAEGHGTVLAEDRNGVLPSYLGLRFPASDIPAQARALYRMNRIRLIPSADYVPCPVEPALSPVDGRPVDLSFSALRSVSPVHLEYMRNMGTGSSMSVSILVGGGLWGLVSAHSAAPRSVGAQMRTACDLLGQVLSLQIDARQQAAHAAERLDLKGAETELLARLSESPSFQEGLVANPGPWLALARADGAAVVTRDRVLTVGTAPSEDRILALAARLQSDRQESYATDSLAADWPEAEAFADVASGVIALPVSQIHPDMLFWFRPEVVRTVSWSGDPRKPVEPGGGRLHPRKSFDLWKEQVRLHALPWSPAEIESAEAFRTSIQALVLRRAEERAELTEKLEASNRELEAFSYSISHDLRAPFRHIVGYAQLLADREKLLDERSQHYLRTIREAALASGRLVDDLLQFSQLGRSQLKTSPVDMRKLVADVRRSLEPDTAGRSIEWRVGPLPDAWGDPSMLRQVFQNLLHNAVKYTAREDHAVIDISARDLGDSVAYTVADNGVGFEMDYVGKLFGVFQRLHRAEDFEGTGIGLALVKRIVDRHGGTVAAKGTPGQGSEFTFVLPRRRQEGRVGR